MIKRCKTARSATSTACALEFNGVWVRPRQPGQTDMEYQVRSFSTTSTGCAAITSASSTSTTSTSSARTKNAYPINCEAMGGRQVHAERSTAKSTTTSPAKYEYADGSRMFSYCAARKTLGAASASASGSKETADIKQGIIRVKGGEAYRYRGKDDGNP